MQRIMLAQSVGPAFLRPQLSFWDPLPLLTTCSKLSVYKFNSTLIDVSLHVAQGIQR